MHPDDLTGEHMGVHQESSAPGSLTQNAHRREACGRGASSRRCWPVGYGPGPLSWNSYQRGE